MVADYDRCRKCGTTEQTYENQFTIAGVDGVPYRWCQDCHRGDGFRQWWRGGCELRKYWEVKRG